MQLPVFSLLFSVVDWVKGFPLRTIRRIIHLVCPAMSTYELRVEHDYDEALIQWIRWSPKEETITESSDLARPTVTVFVQAPWILSETDLKVFANSSTVGRISPDL